MWWPSLETSSNLFTWGPHSQLVLTPGGHWSIFGWQAGGTHPISMLSCCQCNRRKESMFYPCTRFKVWGCSLETSLTRRSSEMVANGNQWEGSHQDLIVWIHLCEMVSNPIARTIRVPGVTEYFDPPLKILAPALITQKKWSPSHKRHLIFYLNINSTTKFSCFWI